MVIFPLWISVLWRCRWHVGFVIADKVFGPSTNSKEVYDVAARPVVKAAMEGVNGMQSSHPLYSQDISHSGALVSINLFGRITGTLLWRNLGWRHKCHPRSPLKANPWLMHWACLDVVSWFVSSGSHFMMNALLHTNTASGCTIWLENSPNSDWKFILIDILLGKNSLPMWSASTGRRWITCAKCTHELLVI